MRDVSCKEGEGEFVDRCRSQEETKTRYTKRSYFVVTMIAVVVVLRVVVVVVGVVLGVVVIKRRRRIINLPNQ